MFRKSVWFVVLGAWAAGCMLENGDGGDGVNLNVNRPLCGNGVVEEPEECDDGMENSDFIPDACRANCAAPRCGDGIVDTGEACDDGNAMSGDGCSADCLSNERCSNGYVDTGRGEQCDDGNQVDWDGCRWCRIVEFMVNSTTENVQLTPSTAVSGDGSWVVVWASATQDGSGFGVFGQRYDSAGTPAGGEFRVNTETCFDEEEPAVAMAEDGRFVVVWQSGDTETRQAYDVHGQRYDSTGAPDGDWFVVNTYTPGDQITPAVAMAEDGRFTVAWVDAERDGSGEGIFGRRFDASGNPMGTEFQVNVYTQDSQNWPAAAAAADGRFVVVWTSQGQDGSQEGVFGRLYDSSGEPTTGEFQVNTVTEREQQWPAVAMTPDGAFVVVWADRTGPGDYDVSGQRFDALGDSVGSAFKVNTYTERWQSFPSVAAAADGRFVVLWDSDEQDGHVWGVFGRRFDPSAVPVGPEFQVNLNTEDHQWFVSVSMTPDGRFVAAWESRFQDGDNWGIFGQRYTADGQVRGLLPW